jgi:hypothetical protein
LMQATAGHETGAPRFAVWNSESRERGKGNPCHHGET